MPTSHAKYTHTHTAAHTASLIHPLVKYSRENYSVQTKGLKELVAIMEVTESTHLDGECCKFEPVLCLYRVHG